MARQTSVKTLPRTVSAAGGGKTKKGELKENTAAKTRETTVKILPLRALCRRDFALHLAEAPLTPERRRLGHL